MFNVQSIIVYIIIAATAFFIIRHVCRQIKGKRNGCNCGSCPMHEGECHCGTTRN